jgi:TonB family protein
MNMRAFVYGVLLAASTLAIASPQDGPQTKKSVDPAYPEILKRAGIEGEVFIKAVINEQGFVEKAEVIKTSNKDFNAATIDAAKKWEFVPANKDGKAIKAEVTIPFRYRLAEKSNDAKSKELYKLQNIVEQFLRGSSTQEILSLVDPGAYLIAGSKYENLRSVLSDNKKKKLYLNIPEGFFGSSHLKTDAAESSAFLVLISQGSSDRPAYNHTIVFMKSESGDWHIQAWHTSH